MIASTFGVLYYTDCINILYAASSYMFIALTKIAEKVLITLVQAHLHLAYSTWARLESSDSRCMEQCILGRFLRARQESETSLCSAKESREIISWTSEARRIELSSVWGSSEMARQVDGRSCETLKNFFHLFARKVEVRQIRTWQTTSHSPK